MASAYLAGRNFGLFDDDVFTSADLNRRSSEVLNRARLKPVTINRNSEQFALLRRDQAAELVRTSNQFGPTIELIGGALSVLEKKEPPPSLHWLNAFDGDDLRKLVREVLAACAAALHETGDWESVETVIHEWQESAAVALNPALAKARDSERDETSLPDPRAENDAVSS